MFFLLLLFVLRCKVYEECFSDRRREKKYIVSEKKWSECTNSIKKNKPKNISSNEEKKNVAIKKKTCYLFFHISSSLIGQKCCKLRHFPFPSLPVAFTRLLWRKEEAGGKEEGEGGKEEGEGRTERGALNGDLQRLVLHLFPFVKKKTYNMKRKRASEREKKKRRKREREKEEEVVNN